MSTIRRRVLLLLGSLAACTVYNTPRVSEVPRPVQNDSVLVQTPVKAHLLDGSTVVYPAGIRVVRGMVMGNAAGPANLRYGLNLRDSVLAGPIPLDSVLAFETFQNSNNVAASITLTLLGTAATAVGGAVLAVAIFGSCPTVYTDSGGTQTLEAETFSYSIAPLFEARDVDALRGGPDTTGTLRLEVRNEALETHYLNQLEVVQGIRGRDEALVPAANGTSLAVRDLVPPATARDRRGRDVRPDVLAADGRAFSTSSTVLESATADDPADMVELTFPHPAGQDTATIVLHMRNSLLNTVLLYDVMLAQPGLRSLDWVGRDLHRVGTAARLGSWYARNFGMRVAVRNRGRFEEVGRIGDAGPIAWKDVAATVPVPAGDDSLHIRLSFVADDWRIDRVALAGAWRRVTPSPLAAVRVKGSAGATDTAALESLRDADGRYLVTRPGDRFFIEFRPRPVPTDSTAAFLLVSQGYYIEWLRGRWVQPHLTGAAFRPNNDAAVQALRRWRREAPELERRFYTTRFPVR